MSTSKPPAYMWPSVVCPRCDWTYSEWNDDAGIVVASLGQQASAHVREQHPEYFAEYERIVAALNQPKQASTQ